jgi:hypothetical protein
MVLVLAVEMLVLVKAKRAVAGREEMASKPVHTHLRSCSLKNYR